MLKTLGWLGEGLTRAGEPVWAQGHGSSLVLEGKPAGTQRVAGWLVQPPMRCVSSSSGWAAPGGAWEHAVLLVVQLLPRFPVRFPSRRLRPLRVTDRVTHLCCCFGVGKQSWSGSAHGRCLFSFRKPEDSKDLISILVKASQRETPGFSFARRE